jgi:cytochrome c-type biogenesis protein CcmH/NrfG
LIWTQVHARDKNQIRQGVKAADSLLKLGAEESRQLLYLASVGEYKLGKYGDARARLKMCLSKDPDAHQAKRLLQAIEDAMTNDTIVAGGVVAAVVGVSAAVAGVLLSGGRR